MSERSLYSIQIKRSAEKELDRVPRATFARMSQAIQALESNPRPRNSTKLRGVEEYRLRVGDYRILYLVDDSNRSIEVIAVGHRRDVYRGL